MHLHADLLSPAVTLGPNKDYGQSDVSPAEGVGGILH